MRKGRLLGAVLLMTGCAVTATLAQDVHYSPEERLDAIDAALIATAKRSIDFASYALTDPVVLDALNEAERRGVAVRIVLDPRGLRRPCSAGAAGWRGRASPLVRRTACA